MDLKPQPLDPEISPAWQASGVVHAVLGDALVIRCGSLDVSAQVAASCLLEPAIGDRVWVAVVDDAAAYVLAVLVAAEPGHARVRLAPGLTLAAAPGEATLKADGALTLVARQAIDLRADRIGVFARSAEFLATKCRWLGDALEATFGRLRLTGDHVDVTARQLLQHADESLRTVRGTDAVRAGAIDQRAVATLHLQGRDAVVHARDLVKVDGGQVHLG